MNRPVYQIMAALFGLALLRSLLLLLVVPIGYGPDGGGYLVYMDSFRDPSLADTAWNIRGTTPVYPLFAYAAYLISGSGYSIAFAQILLGALVPPLIFLALRSVHQSGAFISAVLIAIDPQTGYLFQLVATEGLYIPLLGLGLAAFWLESQREGWRGSGLVGLLLGLGALARPIGTFLIAPYLFFYAMRTRSLKRSALLLAGYALIVLLIMLLNLVRFDFFAPYNTSGLYLGTRLFGVGGLYDRANGSASEELYQLALACDLSLTDESDAKTLSVVQNLRLCLIMEHDLSLEAIGSLYSRAYAEASTRRPTDFVFTMLRQVLSYTTTLSDPFDVDYARGRGADCAAEVRLAWHEPSEMFCPAFKPPLAALDGLLFAAMLAFNLLTSPLTLVLAAWLYFKTDQPQIRQVWLFCFGLYAYHAVVTAAAGTILSRYVTVTNPYVLIMLGFSLAVLLERYRAE